jgi:hypothetical protein
MNRVAGGGIQTMRTMNVRQAIILLTAVSISTAVALAQTPDAQPPIISFDFVLAGAQPPHYSISVEGSGKAAYRSDDELNDQAKENGNPFLVKFIVSSQTAQRIFDLAKTLNYFKGDFEYHGGRVANMGAKTITFKNGDAQNTTTYNYSQNADLQQLTTVFQGISNALEYRRRLERLYRYDKLGLDAELKRMEDDVKRNYVAELQVDESILKQIASDPAIMNISRKRADALLTRIGNSPQESGKK